MVITFSPKQEIKSQRNFESFIHIYYVYQIITETVTLFLKHLVNLFFSKINCSKNALEIPFRLLVVHYNNSRKRCIAISIFNQIPSNKFVAVKIQLEIIVTSDKNTSKPNLNETLK